MSAVDQPTDYRGELRAMHRRIRQVETANPFAGASITRGTGLRLGMPAAIYLDANGSIVAGGVSLTRDQLAAGGAFIRSSGGGQVGAGGTLIGGDGNISHSSGTTRFNGSVSAGGGVAASGGVSGSSASFAGAVGAGSVYSVGQVNAGGVYSRGDIATEGKVFIGAQDVGFDIGAARYVADQAYALAQTAQSLANGRVTQAQLQAVQSSISAIASTLAAVIGRVNEHQQWWEQAGKPSRPPLVQG